MSKHQEVVQRPVGVNERPSLAISRALAEIQGVTVFELDPIHHYVDLELLDQFVDYTTEGDQDLRVEFTIEDYRIILHNDTRVIIQEKRIS